MTYINDILFHTLSKTVAMETFTKAKKRSGGDKSEVDLSGFQWAMTRLSQVCVYVMVINIQMNLCFRTNDVYLYLKIHICELVCVYVYVYACLYIFVHVYVDVYVHVYVCL